MKGFSGERHETQELANENFGELGEEGCTTATGIVRGTKRIGSRVAKLASLREVRDDIFPMKREGAKLLTAVMKAREHLLTMYALTHQQEVMMELLMEREKTLEHNIASVK